jgi:fibro-slime domain-containing protein
VIYRDFQPENVASGGHPDFFFLGTKMGGSQSPTTICVPNSAGPSRGNDSTARCWGIADATLLNGKPQPGATTTCACQFSDWNFPNSSRIPGNYTLAANDSPLSDGNGGYLGGGSAGAPVSVAGNAGTSAGTMMGFTPSTPGGPIWKGTTPAYKDANSFGQWFNDDSTVNKTFAGVIEMKSIGTNIYQYASTVHLAQGGFYPLDSLNPSQATLCNLSPYWNHGNGNSIWTTCVGDQYFVPPRVIQSDCPTQNPITNGCWVTAVQGIKHDSYFTEEAHYYFVYDGSVGFDVRVFANDDLFLFINGKLVLDLGGVHQQLPGMVTITGNPGNATITEGGCLDPAGNITQICNPTSSMVAPQPVSPDDYRTRTLSLGLVSGLTYELALFGANRQPTDSNLQISLNGSTSKRSVCVPRCGDGIVTAGEECDCGDGTVTIPPDCLGSNNDSTYGGCTTQCKFAAFCGDGIVNGPEQCDLGKMNGDTPLGANGCTLGCTKPHYCGDGIVDANLGEQCDLGDLNGLPGQPCDTMCMMFFY